MSSYPRNRTPGIQLPGITESLNAPGLAVPPPVSRGANEAGQLMQALGLVGGVFGEAASAVQYDRAAREREAAKAHAEKDRIDQQARLYDEGQASLNARQDIQQLASDVQAGKITADQAREKIAGNTDGFSPAYSSKYQELTLPHIAAAQTNRGEFVLKQAQNDAAINLAGGLVGQTDPAKITESIAQFRSNYPDVTENQARAALLTPALRVAAETGNTKAFDAIAPLLQNSSPVDVQTQRSALALTIAQNEQKAHFQTLETIAAMDNAGEPVSTIKTLIDNTGDITEQQRRELSNNYDAIVARREAQAAHDITKAQEYNVNEIRRQVDFGHYQGSPTDLFNELDRKAALPPDDPNHISAANAASILESLGKSATQNVRLDTVRSGVANYFKTGSTGVPMTKEDGPDLTRVLGQNAGIIDGTTDPKTGAFIPRNIKDPIALAGVAKGANLVPQAVEELIASGISSADPAQQISGFTNYAAIALASPGLASKITLSATDKARARFVQTRLDDMIASNPGLARDNQSLQEAVSSLIPGANRIDSSWANVPKNDRITAALNIDASTPNTTIKQTIATKANESFREYLESDKFLASGVASVGISRQLSNLDTVPGNVLDFYTDTLADEYAIQNSFTPDRDKAIETAQKNAALRTTTEFPPQSWGGKVLFTRKGDVAADPQLLLDDLTKIVGKEQAASIWNSYVPEFVNKDGLAGWRFRSNGGDGRDGYPYYSPNGKDFTINPYINDKGIATATETYKKIAEYRKSRLDNPSYFGVSKNFLDTPLGAGLSVQRND